MIAVGGASFSSGYSLNGASATNSISEPVFVSLNPERQTSGAGAKPVPRLTVAAIAALGQSEQTGPASCSCGTSGCDCAAEKSQIDQLKKIDRETRAHEQAHKSAGGAYASAASYTYEIGPDGRQYAVAGEVQIDSAPIVGDPAASIAKLEIVIKAALAPGQPSAQDFKVAAQARAEIQKAQGELQSKKSDERQGKVDENGQPITENDNPGQEQADQIAELVNTAIA
jgi:hypothetical protein